MCRIPLPKFHRIGRKKQEEKWWNSWIIWNIVGDGHRKLAQPMFFLISKIVTSERPIALVPAMAGWWEALRASEVAKQQEKFRIEWDATDGRNGGAERTLWETFLEMERFSYSA